MIHRQIFKELKDKLHGSSIKVTTDESKYPGVNNRYQYTFIVIKSYDRADTYELVINTLKDLNLNFKKGVYSGSQFWGIEIDNYNKIGKTEKGIRIQFKFPDGKDAKVYNIWNEQLERAFIQNRSLKRIPSDRNEVGVLKSINMKIHELSKGIPITLSIRNKKYKNVIGLVGGVGNKKADFVIVNKDAEEIGYISYKSGNTATSFQQYSGISERSGDKIANHPEVVKFNESIVNNWESLSPSASREIQSNNLKKQAVFGKDYASRPGYDSVDFFVQGDPRLILRGDIIYLTFTTKMVKKGDLTKLQGNYEPVLGARKGERYRRIKTKNKSLNGIRGGIWTRAYMTNRMNNKEI